MTLSNREKWVVIGLPALLTGLVYVFFPGSYANARLASYNEQIKKEREKPLSPQEIKEVSSENQKIQDALKTNREKAVTLAKLQPEKFGSLFSSDEDRGEPLRVISKAIEDHGLFLVKSEKLDSQGRTALPKYMHEKLARLSETFNPPTPQIWRIEVLGSYTRMKEVCDELMKSKAFIVPLNVTMEPSRKRATNEKASDVASEAVMNAGGVFKWTLTVWL